MHLIPLQQLTLHYPSLEVNPRILCLYVLVDHFQDIQVFGDEYIERGGKIQLVCNATGKPDPPHDVEWFKGRERIHSDAENGVIITKKIETKVLVSVLVIRNSKLTDAGNYTCRSSNLDTGTITVYVLNGRCMTVCMNNIISASMCVGA